jgi:hypothetical protein
VRTGEPLWEDVDPDMVWTVRGGMTVRIEYHGSHDEALGARKAAGRDPLALALVEEPSSLAKA